ncbi:MAG TPA: GNAT family N-acetyltransferase [Micromonosporaceae bacterium]|jgi:GNAT superfamily N-acetyltransferase
MPPELWQVEPADEAAIDAYHAVRTAVHAADTPEMPLPTRDQTIGEIRYPAPTIDTRHFVVRHAGAPAAIVACELPGADNTHAMIVDFAVHPGMRRHGIGRGVFAAVVDLAREHRRAVLIGAYCQPLPVGPPRDEGPAAFAAAVGAKPALTDIRRRLDLSTVDQDRWTAAYREATEHAAGYPILWWAGDIPEDLADDVAYLESRLVSDSPIGDLRYEPENYDADRIRRADEVMRVRGDRCYHAGAP